MVHFGISMFLTVRGMDSHEHGNHHGMPRHWCRGIDAWGEHENIAPVG